ncbi:YhcN/YlaJ family sporulation lipoprotein [Alkalihalobacillus xiaoxiensis]|uniref:YhcN/YlaJ family sporulation lipoprotein n=1 Tax=Shouchella xiaoxiensis TaxID=766895 RepID=A0ABS2SQS1_9BACI|nr:YhcN/YlaJ family sporulation lipoprotein [Shouchella xiaoxiensis]MBM7837386.1 YhcN/YlaJ family sporulation lipoprotein [Shouchella xiaoxiensis]
MNKYLKHTVVLSMLSIALVACGNNNDQDMNPDNPSDGVEMDDPNNVEGQGHGMYRDHGNYGDMHMGTSTEVADSVRQLDEVNHAAVIVMGDQAYVAVTMQDESHDVADQVKDRIAEKAKEADSEIKDVHVSANPDFMERLSGYGDRIENGEPISGMADEFKEAMHRMFPTMNR